MKRTNELQEAQDAAAAELYRSMYHGRGMSQQAIADELGIGRRTVIRAMRRLGIETRRPGEKAA